MTEIEKVRLNRYAARALRHVDLVEANLLKFSDIAATGTKEHAWARTAISSVDELRISLDVLTRLTKTPAK